LFFGIVVLNKSFLHFAREANDVRRNKVVEDQPFYLRETRKN
jgi:hypothetical protein